MINKNTQKILTIKFVNLKKFNKKIVDNPYIR